MTLLDALVKLESLKVPVFTTSDAAACLSVSNATTSQILLRLQKKSRLLHLKHAQWAFPSRLEPLAVPQALASPFPAYISLQTALYHHGMISQIPQTIYAVSLARTQRRQTPLGTVSLHHIDAAFFFGFTMDPSSGVQMATAEKALIDVFYLSPGRSALFRALPEVEIANKFSLKRARSIIRRITSTRRRTLVENQFAAKLKLRR